MIELQEGTNNHVSTNGENVSVEEKPSIEESSNIEENSAIEHNCSIDKNFPLDHNCSIDKNFPLDHNCSIDKNFPLEHNCSIDKNFPLEQRVIQQLLKKGYTLTAAESCTGGLFLGRLINVSGASKAIMEGYITYSEDAKIRNVGVLKETLEQYGVVSEEVASEMALGAAKRARAEVGVGITGIAGPNGGSIEKPVGTVCIACVVRETVVVKRFVFSGNREKIRELSVQYALDLVNQCLLTEFGNS